MEAVFDLLVWILKGGWWFVTQLLEGKLPWTMILTALVPTILCTGVGVVLGQR